MPTPVAALAVCAVVLSGCTGEGTEPPRVTVRDSAGVTIVENPAPRDGPVIDDGSSPMVEIGVIDGPPEYQFTRIADVTRLSDGRIVVADGGIDEVRVYGPDGTFERSLGSRGQGPGEFRQPRDVRARPPDTIVVADPLDLEFFTGDGTFLHQTRFDGGRFQALWRDHSPGGVRWAGDGAMVAAPYEGGDDARPSGPHRMLILVARVSADYETVDTLGTFAGTEQERVDIGEARPVAAIHPYFTDTWWSADADDGTIVIGDSEQPEFHLYRPGGSHRIVRWRADPEPVSDEDLERWKQWSRARTGGDPRMERIWAAMTRPDFKAFYDRVHAARDGGVWLEVSDPLRDRWEWLVFDADGTFEGRFSTPDFFIVHEVGADYVLGVHQDDNDVQYVRMYPLGD